ncbi:DUF5133 domain-containing protein [Streptomyces sp. NPDC058653]|uniref:DUF5133 domain-containing protein n=1 Tax=Streptomyces sp. NPDC058653 TaxID=3346576 RepID=UPI00366286CB
MLLAHPAILRKTVEEYEAQLVLNASGGIPGARRRLDDLAYTLCVSTGTRDIESAMDVARVRLAEADAAATSLQPG